MTDQTTLELRSTGRNTTGFRIPDELVERLGGGNRPKVTATIGDFSFRSSIARMGGEFWLGVNSGAKAAWDGLSYSNRRRHAEAVAGAKKPQTRARRVAKVIADPTA